MPVYRAKNGRWFFRSVVEFPDGTRKRISGMPGAPGPYQDLSNTKKAAEAAESRAKAEALTGVSVLRKEPVTTPTEEREKAQTIAEYSETFLRDYRPGSKPSAKLARKQIVSGYILKSEVGKVPLDEFGQKHIDLFVASLLKPRRSRKNVVIAPRSRKTVNNICAVLSSLVKYAGVLDAAALKKLRFEIDYQAPKMEPVAPGDVAAMLEAAGDARYRVAILLAADAGLRIGEIRALSWTDINEVQREISISLSVDRSGNVGPTKGWEEREVPVTDRLWAELELLDRSCAWVLPRLKGETSEPLGYETTRQAILEIYGKAGVSTPAKPWHGLRHTFGTELASAGIPVHDIMRLMGHKNIETTLGYMNTNRDAKRRAIAALNQKAPVRAVDVSAAPSKEKTPAKLLT